MSVSSTKKRPGAACDPAAKTYLKRTPSERREAQIYTTESVRRITSIWRNLYAAHRRIFSRLPKRMALGGVRASVIDTFVKRYHAQLRGYQDTVQATLTQVEENLRRRFPETCAGFTLPAVATPMTFLLDNPASSSAACLIEQNDRVAALMGYLRTQGALDGQEYWKVMFQIRRAWAALVRDTMALGDSAAREAATLLAEGEAPTDLE